MSMLGKILAIFNVLAAVGFLYLAASDWAKRHSWEYAVYRHHVAIDGLPVSEEDTDPGEDTPLIDKMNEKTLQQLFQQAGGTLVKTQREEVQRAKRDLATKIDGLANEAEKRQTLLTTLMPLARTNSEREELRTRIMSEARPFAEVQGDVDSIFQVGKPPENSLGLLLLPHDERAGIAHLLFGLNPKPEDQARLQVILGLRAHAEQVSHQSAALHAMAEQAGHDNMHARTNFEVAYRNVTRDLHARAGFLKDRQYTLEGHRREKERHQDLLTSREKEKQEIVDATQAARERHQAIVKEQRNEESQIFAAQQLYERTKNQNEHLEREIRTLEKVDGEGKKR